MVPARRSTCANPGPHCWLEKSIVSVRRTLGSDVVANAQMRKEDVVAGAAGHRVAGRVEVPVQEVVATAALDHVSVTASDRPVVTVVADDAVRHVVLGVHVLDVVDRVETFAEDLVLAQVDAARETDDADDEEVAPEPAVVDVVAEDVVPALPSHEVRAGPASDDVVASVAFEVVAGATSKQVVVAGPAVQAVVDLAADELVVPLVAVERPPSRCE